MGADAWFSEAIFSRMQGQILLKKLNVQFVSSSSYGHASLLPKNFEIPTIKIQIKNYRNVKPMALETIYYLNSSTPILDSRICPYFPIV